jgi:transcriptional regulator with XRE-family HTH domain
MAKLTPRMCVAARALLGWSQHDLAEKSGIGYSTIADFERGARQPIARNMLLLRDTFVEHRVKLLNNGVQLRKGS